MRYEELVEIISNPKYADLTVRELVAILKDLGSVSNCCSAPMVENTDVCSRCKEHSEAEKIKAYTDNYSVDTADYYSEEGH